MMPDFWLIRLQFVDHTSILGIRVIWFRSTQTSPRIYLYRHTDAAKDNEHSCDDGQDCEIKKSSDHINKNRILVILAIRHLYIQRHTIDISKEKGLLVLKQSNKWAVGIWGVVCTCLEKRRLHIWATRYNIYMYIQHKRVSNVSR